MAKITSYHTGQHFRCTFCHEDSVVKARKVLDGWSTVGEEFVCALCGAAVVSEEESLDEPDVSVAASECDSDTADSRVAALFDGDGLCGSRHFCRDCVHYLKHPFVSRCLLHDKPVEPMQDCPDYSTSGSSERPLDDE